MGAAAVILAVGNERRAGFRRTGRARVAQLARAALEAALEEVVVVVPDGDRGEGLPGEVTVLGDGGGSEASGLRAATDWCARLGHDAIVFAPLDPPLPGADLAADPMAWRLLARSSEPLGVATALGRRAPMVRVGEDRWPLLPLDGRVMPVIEHRCGPLAEIELRRRPEPGPSDQGPSDQGPSDQGPSDQGPSDQGPSDHGPPDQDPPDQGPSDQGPLDLDASDRDPSDQDPLAGVAADASFAGFPEVGAGRAPDSGAEATAEDVAQVSALLGRPPSGQFHIVVRDAEGAPVVIENAPFLSDGTPMPTRYWLVGRAEREAVGRLESSGAVRELERRFPPGELAALHERYARERDALIDSSYVGPRPSGGVGGTRQGLKCLHAHLAWYLAGGRDPVGRFVAFRLGRELSGPVASVDCGTNSTRLLILDRRGRTLRREMTITRLGQGVDETGRLDPTAIARTLETLDRYRQLCDDAGVVAIRAVATSAARDAANREQLFEGSEAALGVALELLSGREEGELSYRGATGDRSGEGPFLVVDVGGGSTEFAAGLEDAPAELADVVSVDMGCVRLTERFFRSDPPTADELERARDFVRHRLGSLISEHPSLAIPREMVGVAGTVATLATRSLELSDYDGRAAHGARVRRSFVEAELAELAALSVEERRRCGGIEEARADVIVGGLVVVAEVMAHFSFDELVYSEHDILDGLALSLIDPLPVGTGRPDRAEAPLRA